MARYFKFAFLMLICITSFCACQEGSEAGELLGQWRLTGSDTKNIKFSGGLTFISDLNTGGAWGHFQQKGDSLFIQCYSPDGLPSDTTVVEEVYGFKPFCDIRLRIERIDSDHLTLTKDDKKWDFYKF